MKYILFFISAFLLSCNQKSNLDSKKIIHTVDTSSFSENLLNNNNDNSNSDTEIIETFADSLNIGQKGKCKIELIKHRVYDDNFVIIKFYVKGPNSWYIQNTYLYETNALMEFQPEISDYNNDDYNDITFISGTAARGANEVRRLFIYDMQNKELISVVNSQDFPNIQYNKELDCIDAFMVHGTSTTVFAKILGDSLKTFANVQNSEKFHTINLVDKNGNEKELYKVKSNGVYTRHKNYKPLLEY
jgi:hypothetical protein